LVTAAEFAAQSAAHAALLAAAAARKATKAADDIALQNLRAKVKDAFAAGVEPKNIVKASGLSRTTIYEIRDDPPSIGAVRQTQRRRHGERPTS
jgi:hypothetical protein